MLGRAAVLSRAAVLRRAAVLTRAAVLVSGAAVLGACGSQDDVGSFPPAAAAARSPALSTAPAGRVVPVGAGAEGVAVDARTGLVGVAVRDPAALVLLDVDTLRVVRRIPLPRPARHVALAAPGGPLLVPVDGSRIVVTVALPDGRAEIAQAGDPAHAALATAAGIVSGDGVALIPGGPVARLAARARRLDLVDRRTGDVLASEAVGVAPAHLEAGDDGRVYVADTGGGSVLLVRTRPELGVVRRAALPGAPYGTAIDRREGKLWVTLTDTNEVAQLTADGQPREQRRYGTVRQPNSVAVHEPTGRVFVTGRADGVLQVFDGYAKPAKPAGR